MDSKALLIAAAREIGLNTKHTGGGCMALSLEISGDYPSISGAEILITDDGGANIPSSLWDITCIMGIYDADGECILTKPGSAIDLLSMVSGFRIDYD